MTLRELDVYARLPQRVVSADGVFLALEDGRRVLDLYGGHCVNTLGAGDAGLERALAAQWRELSFATNLVHTGARERFLAAFGANLPPGDWRLFLSNSGAEANENALKAAFASARPARRAVVAFEGAFHGRTAAAAAVSAGHGSGPYPNSPFEVRRVPLTDARRIRAAIDADVAAVLLEPIQSLAGVVPFAPELLRELRVWTREAGALLLFDEVQTGNGRLGPPWASQALGVVPDGFTTAKGAAGGLPIGITVLAEHVAVRVGRDHFGSTFGGGPTVLAAATEVASRIGAPGFAAGVETASRALCAAVLSRAGRRLFRAVRGRGLLLGLLLADGVGASEAQALLLEAGVLVGTSADPGVLRANPPLTFTVEHARLVERALDSLSIPVA